MIPHVAAGDNLDMPVVGPLLRRGGAFFMRRSFGDDRLYSAVFSEYLYQLFRRGSPSEYFIEGGRSRTGRLLPPRTGLLNMTIATHVRGVPRPIVFVPVNIGYEKLIEAIELSRRTARRHQRARIDPRRAAQPAPDPSRCSVACTSVSATRCRCAEFLAHTEATGSADGARAGRRTAQSHQRMRQRQPDQPDRARYA